MDMGTNVTTILHEVKSKGIVDGRIDVVAHSMGGLLVRAYSSGTCTTTGYRSLKNRCQGQFHTIVTLDTPEAGSGLATYLLAHQQATLQETLTSGTKSEPILQSPLRSVWQTTVTQSLLAALLRSSPAAWS
jgi:hypothetical protein